MGPKKPPAKSAATGSTRIRRLTRRQKKQAEKRKIRSKHQLPGSFSLVRQALGTMRLHWKPLMGIMVVYLILDIAFASGISNINSRVSEIKLDLELGHGFWNILSTIGPLAGGGGIASSQTTSVLQILLIVMGSLVIIWALRHLLCGNKVGIRQAYYQAMAPFVPFVLIILVIFIQLLPPTLGAAIINAIVATVVNSSGVLIATFIAAFALLAIWSIYMISSSIFALYIVTLPEMQPLQALRSARNLVRFRRWQVIRRVVFLPLLSLVVMAVIIIPFLLYVPFLAVAIFYLLSVSGLLFAHTYLYTLYRSLLDAQN